MKDSQRSTIPLIAGILGGSSSTVLLYPLDLIKVRLQVNEYPSKQRNQQQQKMWKVLRAIIRHEGFAGLYNGLTPAVIGSSASWGGYFFLYEGSKRRLLEYKKRNGEYSTMLNSSNSDVTKLGPMENFAAACLSGAIIVGFTNPIWLVKTRMQLQMKKTQEQQRRSKSASSIVSDKIKPPYKNMVDAIRTIVREEGPTSLYKGSVPALMLVSHGGVQFVCYEFLKGHFGVYKKASRPSFISTATTSDKRSILIQLENSVGYLTMGAISKIVATTVTYPLQVIKSRLQQRSQTTELSATGEVEIVKREYAGVVDCARRIWYREGISGFFKGCLPNAIRVAPSAAITFVVYESVIDFMKE